MKSIDARFKWHSGSYLVAVGAAMWSLDSLFRSRLAGTYSAFLIVFLTQFISMAVVLPLCWIERRNILKLERRDWLAFLFLAVFSNILAMAAFTFAFAHATNYSTPVLIQKLQPLISILTAVFFLKEELPKNYFAFAGLALAGSVMVSAGEGMRMSMESRELITVLFALLAALLWGIGTTAGRFVSTRHSFLLVTVVRYGLSALVMLVCLPFWWQEIADHRLMLLIDFQVFAIMALIPGLLALFIYYRGLQSTKASVACWLELAYPIAAIAVNWVFLGSTLNGLQIAGSILLLISVTLMTQRKSNLSSGILAG